MLAECRLGLAEAAREWPDFVTFATIGLERAVAVVAVGYSERSRSA